jgi:phage-related protein
MDGNSRELRVRDKNKDRRIVYRIDTDAILMAGIWAKTTRTTPKSTIEVCRERFAAYDRAVSQARKKRK